MALRRRYKAGWLCCDTTCETVPLGRGQQAGGPAGKQERGLLLRMLSAAIGAVILGRALEGTAIGAGLLEAVRQDPRKNEPRRLGARSCAGPALPHRRRSWRRLPGEPSPG